MNEIDVHEAYLGLVERVWYPPPLNGKQSFYIYG